MYGPILYLVLPLGGLYLAADVLLLYTVFKGQGSGSGNGTMQNGSLYHEVSNDNINFEYLLSTLTLEENSLMKT